MKNIQYSMCLMTACILLSGGCATRRLDSAMIHYIPENHMQKRTERELLNEVNRILPLQIKEDNFMATHSVDGHTCWIIIEDTDDVPAVSSAIKRARNYKYIAIGYFDPRYRTAFGFKPLPEPTLNAQK